MAEAGVQLQRESFSCSVCLELLKEVVTIPCGHSYCRRCISNFWDGEKKKKGVFSCPQCRQTFTPRPVLMKNTMLAELVEKLKESSLQEDPSLQSYAGAEDVACDICTGRKLKAFKSCLNCVASYCETHLQQHNEVTPRKRHKLVDPSKELQEKICSRHEEVMKMFCRSDQQWICIYCSMEDHKGHDVVSAAAESEKKLQESRADLHKDIQDREKEAQLLEEQLKSLQLSAGQTVKHNQQVFTELIHLLQRRSSEMEKEVRSKLETEERAVRSLQEKLEEEIKDLKERVSELKKLSNIKDPVQFVHSSSSLSVLSVSTHSSSSSSLLTAPPVSCFQEVTAAVSELRDHLHDVLMEKTDVCETVEKVGELLQPPEPTSRAGFLQYSKEITLDPNTVHTKIRLTRKNKKASLMNKIQNHPDHPERFTKWYQVLSRESLTGRCYWEVGVVVIVSLGRGRVDLGVSYKSIGRAGSDAVSEFGCGDKSWMLLCDRSSYRFLHNNVITPVSGTPCYKIGVFVDQPAGILSFYSVTDTMTLLHRVHASFSEPLLMGLRFGYYGGASAEICNP